MIDTVRFVFILSGLENIFFNPMGKILNILRKIHQSTVSAECRVTFSISGLVQDSPAVVIEVGAGFRRSLHPPHIIEQLTGQLLEHPALAPYSHLLAISPHLSSLLTPSALAREPLNGLRQGILEPLR
jgi:hypothetical protein